MNRYLMIRRLRGPLFLLLLGVCALLHQMNVLTWWHAWPLFLILWGVMLLAERAAINEADLPPYPGGYPGVNPGPNPGANAGPNMGPYAGPTPGVPGQNVNPAPTAATAIVPVHGDEITHRGNDGGEQ
jgi:hypothetical protein